MKPSRFKTWLLAAAVLFGLAVGGGALADEGPARLALIINQADYSTLTPLPDTDGEAGEIKDSLVKLGFDVTSVRDLTVDGHGGHPSFDQVLKDFRFKVASSPGAIAFIYYTGHGMADPTDGNGENYLLGVDADIRVAADLPASGVKLSQLTNEMSRTDAKALIIVLDACRDTPSIGKGVTKGLVPITPDDNTLIAYSTDLGSVAGVGVYAPVLAKELLKPNEKITDVFFNVQVDVSQQTNHKQKPWVNNRIYDAICLSSCEINVTVQQAAATPADVNWQKEQAVWSAARDCIDFKSYLAAYPRGAFASMAQGRLDAPSCQAGAIQAPTQAVASLQPAAPPAGGRNIYAEQACEEKAASATDLDRPRGVAGVLPRDLDAPAAIAACTSALQGDPANRYFAYNLGRAYEKAKDYDHAKTWYQKAADEGSGAAMYGMGNLYFAGLGVDSDDAQALAWFHKGADLGNCDAMLYIGILYDSGVGVDEDKTQARKWYKAAIKAGNTGAQALLDMM